MRTWTSSFSVCLGAHNILNLVQATAKCLLNCYANEWLYKWMNENRVYGIKTINRTEKRKIFLMSVLRAKRQAEPHVVLGAQVERTRRPGVHFWNVWYLLWDKNLSRMGDLPLERTSWQLNALLRQSHPSLSYCLPSKSFEQVRKTSISTWK